MVLNTRRITLVLLAVYAVFAVLFGWLVFGRGAACRVAKVEG